jgi:hypothetical protein
MPVSGLSGPFRISNFYGQSDGLAGNGWTENAFCSGTSYTLIKAALVNLIPARLSMCTPNIVYRGTRISYPGQPLQDIVVTAASLGLGGRVGTYAPTSGTATTATSPSDVALLFRMNDINFFHSNIWIHGVPQAVVNGNSFVPDAAFSAAKSAWLTQVTAHYMIKESTGVYSAMTGNTSVSVRNRKVGRAFPR